MGVGDGSRYIALARLILQFEESIYAFKQLPANLLARPFYCVQGDLPRLALLCQHLPMLNRRDFVLGNQPHPVNQSHLFHNLSLVAAG